MTPTALTLKLLRRWRFVADVAERWLTIPARAGEPERKIRKDLFGAVDVVAIDPREGRTWLVQCTSLSGLSARVSKLRGLPVMAQLVKAVRVECWGWAKRGDKWAVKRVEIRGDTLEPVEVEPRRRRGPKRIQGNLFDSV